MGSPASLLFLALLVHSDDAWEVPALEGVFDSRLRALADFPAPLYPPDLEDEMTAALAELARLDPDSAASRARSLIAVVSHESELTWTARRVLAASRLSHPEAIAVVTGRLSAPAGAENSARALREPKRLARTPLSRVLS